MAEAVPFSTAALADRLVVARVDWNLTSQDEYSGTGDSEALNHNLGSRLWMGDITTRAWPHLAARAVMSRVDMLDDGAIPFYLYNPLGCYPAYDPGGTKLGANVATIHTLSGNNKEMRLTGLPAGYVLTEGDLLAFDYDLTRRAMLRIAKTVTANGAGLTPLFEFRPHAPLGTAAAIVVTLIKPAAKVKLVSGSARMEQVAGTTSRIRLRVRQTLLKE